MTLNQFLQALRELCDDYHQMGGDFPAAAYDLEELLERYTNSSRAN